jgi:hypothetical protein
MNYSVVSQPVKVQVNETDKTFTIHVPWDEICESNREVVWAWFAGVRRIRAELEGKGHTFK